MDQANGLRNIIKSDATLRRKNYVTSSNNKLIPRVIAITSGKGGVGKTNITGNLAIALTRLGKRVVVIDADVGLSNVDIIFNIRPEYNIKHVISGEKKLTEVMVTTEHGVMIIPGGTGFANFTQLTDSEKLNFLTEFEVLDDKADIVLIDTAAGISSNVLYFNSGADESIVIATKEPTSLTDSYALMKVLSQNYGIKYFKLIVNMVSFEKDAKIVYKALSEAMERFLGNVVLEYFGYIPSDPLLQKAVLKRTTVLDYNSNAPSGINIKMLAQKIANSTRTSTGDGNIKFFMKKIFNVV